MQSLLSRQVLLRRRPTGEPKVSDFELAEAPVPPPGDGEFLCRTIYLSLDPYMRGRMNDAKSYAQPVELGTPMVGGAVSEVIASNNASFPTGSFVVGPTGWQAYALSRGAGVRKLDPKAAPLSTALGVLGMPGMTAYVGLLDIGQPKPGETVVVSAAAGAVGSVVGQLAKIRGCRAVGVAGAPAKCEFVVKELGFDACVNYRAEPLVPALQKACPTGIDVYFDNVGGDVLAAVLRLINPFAHSALRPDLAVQRHGAPARPEPLPAPRQPGAHPGLHRLRPRRPLRRLPPRRDPMAPRGQAPVPGGHRRRSGERPGGVPRPPARQELRQARREGRRRPNRQELLRS